MPAPAGAVYLTDLGLAYKTFVGSGSPIKKVLAADDLGKISICTGTAAQVMEIPNYAITPFSMTDGLPVFRLFRQESGNVSIDPPATNDLGTVAARTSLTSAVVGDSCTESGSGITYVLTTAGGGTAGHWTALPTGAPGQPTINNPASLELLQLGAPRGCFMFAPNEWAWL